MQPFSLSRPSHCQRHTYFHPLTTNWSKKEHFNAWKVKYFVLMMISIMHYHNVKRNSDCFDISGKFFVIGFVKMCNYITIAVCRSPLVSKVVKLCFFLNNVDIKILAFLWCLSLSDSKRSQTHFRSEFYLNEHIS